ncbi:MAG: Flagellar hook-basal body complex protein FliE [Anaerolineae bacterium]|nr:Flagellar hook-basal body complex protein FliE [Anaerolineae bacterium]
MPVDPVSSISSISRLTQPEGAKNAGQVGAAFDDFGSILNNAINTLSQKENTANQAVASLAAGEDIELHQVMIAMQEADISFQLALEVRNKIVDAYQDIMRMQM